MRLFGKIDGIRMKIFERMFRAHVHTHNHTLYNKVHMFTTVCTVNSIICSLC